MLELEPEWLAAVSWAEAVLEVVVEVDCLVSASRAVAFVVRALVAAVVVAGLDRLSGRLASVVRPFVLVAVAVVAVVLVNAEFERALPVVELVVASFCADAGRHAVVVSSSVAVAESCVALVLPSAWPSSSAGFGEGSSEPY